MPRGTQVSASSPTAFAYAAITLFGPTFQRGSTSDGIGNSTVADPTTPAAPNTQSSQPDWLIWKSRQKLRTRSYDLIACKVQQVWAVPISLATTLGISVDFSSSRY